MKRGPTARHDGSSAQRGRWLWFGWPLHVALGLCVLALHLAGAFDFLDAKLQDLRFRLLQQAASDDVVIVAIDPQSLSALPQWPWPRSYHAIALDTLMAAGARRVAFDVDFSARRDEPGDAQFEAALDRYPGRVVLPIFKQRIETRDGTRRLAETRPLPRFSRSVELASVNVFPAPDGLIRSAPVRDAGSDRALPSLSAVLADNVDFPANAIVVDFGIRAAGLPRLSFVDVLSGTFDPASIADRQVIVGATAVELGDMFAVPHYHSLPGVVLHALAAQSLRGTPLQAVSRWWALAGLLPVVLIMVWRAQRWRWQLVVAVPVLAGLSLFAFSVALQAIAALVVPAASVMLLVVLLAVLQLIVRLERQAVLLLLQHATIRRKDAMMQHVVEHSIDGIAGVDLDGTVLWSNPAFCTIFGIPANRLVGAKLSSVLDFLDSAASGPDLIGALRTDHGLFEVDCRRADGSELPLELAVATVAEQERAILTVLARDITERRADRAALEHQALHDGLTGLPNRTLLQSRLTENVRAAQRLGASFCLLMLDLNRFKEINDTLGHHVGDQLLCRVAERLVETMRAADTVARLGGDEFAVILPAPTGLVAAEALCERLVEAFALPIAFAGLTFEVGISCGIAVFPEHGREPAELLQYSDVAMYAAKQDLKSVAVYDPERDQNSVRRLALAGELRAAIEKGEVSIHYQPKVDLRRGLVSGAEALVRWHHPTLGFVSPDEFVPMAEQSGLIQPLTTFVLEQAVEACRGWREQWPGTGIAVNLSARMLQFAGLVETVAGVLQASGLPAAALTLEITESAIMGEPDRALAMIDALHAQGVRLSIDDYGTGYSNLAYLNQLPASELKIDKHFVMGMLLRTGDDKIVRSTIELAHSLGLEVVAEGIEDRPTMAALAAAGCEVGQGYFFGKPMPLDAFEAWLADSVWGRPPTVRLAAYG